MTCICALKQGNTIYMVGDSAGAGGGEIYTRKDPKIFQKKGFLIGSAGSWRDSQIIEFHQNFPPLKEKDIFTYLCSDFVKSLRKCLKKHSHSEGDESFEGSILLGIGGGIYVIDEDFHVAMNDYPYFSVGSGAQLALGSMFTNIRNGEKNPKKILTDAMDAACEFSLGVRAPYVFLHKTFGKINNSKRKK